MSFNLDRSQEIENGIVNDGAVVMGSMVGSIRSTKPTYTNDLLTELVYYKSLTQIDANRLYKATMNYNAEEELTSVDYTFYKGDGVSVFSTKTETITYTGDDATNVEEQI